MKVRNFGAHVSVAGGLHRAFEAAREATCECLQIFVRNQRQWRARRLGEDQVAQWRAAARASAIKPVVAHASYLVNLASGDRQLRQKSIDALTDELERCEVLGIRALVVHPGAAGDASVSRGLLRIIRAVDAVHRRTGGSKVRLLLETTAGQGTSVGHRFEHLARIIQGCREPQRLGVCLDTCHIFAAGYPLRDASGYRATLEEFEDVVGVRQIRCLHLNDSKRGLGSRVDRHEHIGRGRIGLAGFRHVVNDPRFERLPKIIETPKGQDARGRDLDLLNLRRLRRLVRR